MAVDWRVAPSLDVLLGQINRAAPLRSKASDGSIGDEDHEKRDSDHNPWVFLRGRYWVTARDFTHDPDDGLDCGELFVDLVTSRDPRIKYLIWRDRITSGAGGPSPWVPRSYAYAGPNRNRHEHHLHLSVVADSRMFGEQAWELSGGHLADPVPRNPPTGRRNLSIGAVGSDVRALQTLLNKTFPAYSKLAVDGRFGPATKASVTEFQRRSNLAPDGIVGPQTYTALARYGYR